MVMMMKNKHKFILFLIGCILLINIHNIKAEPIAPLIEAYFPHTVGSYWVYQGEGGEFDGLLGEYRFTGTTTLRDGTPALIRVFSLLYKVKQDTGYALEMEQDTSYVVIEPAKVRILADKIGRDDMIFLTDELTEGAEWKAKPVHRSQNVRVAKVGRQIKVPAGEFEDCIDLERVNLDFSKFQYTIAPNVGMIMFGYKTEEEEAKLSQTIWKLIGYSIK